VCGELCASYIRLIRNKDSDVLIFNIITQKKTASKNNIPYTSGNRHENLT